MNKLVLIGNGFDLAHGLKTKYSDFIVWYLNKVLNSLLKNPIYDDDLLRIESRYLLININIVSIEGFNNKINNENTRVIYKHDFFKQIVLASKDYGWVDIEYEYYATLINIFRKLEKINLDRFPSISLELKHLNSCFDFIKKELVEYLLTIDYKLHKIEEDISKHFFEGIVQPFTFNKKADNYGKRVLFLNFNYTSTVELYLKDDILKNYCTVNYIHGKLNDNQNPIIFGYGDEMDTYYEKIERLNHNDFLNIFKSFGYFRTKNYQNLINFIDSDSFYVYIMGHSCGLSDRVLLNSIFEHSNCKSIKIYYFQKNETENDFFEKTQEISRHFKAEGKAKMREIIVPFPECKPLTNFKS
ncbi:MAG: hypothetical protein HGB12_04030 [Bacteroidetes bacterium]|nr:hypothetical protein [Bacteroidota bacterium]